MKQNQGNKQKNIQSKPLRKIMVMIIAMVFVFTACHEKNNTFLLLPLIDNSSVATNDGGSGSGVVGSGDGGSGSGVVGSGDGGSGSGVVSSGDGGSGSGVVGSGDGGSGSGVGSSGDGGSGSGVGSSGNGGSGSGAGSSGNGGSGSGAGSSGNGGSGNGGQTFTPAIGVLDTSFNSPKGFIIQPIGSSNDWGYSLAIQPDGKILLGGSCYNGSNYDFCIARFNSNGTLDTSFGTSGKVIQPIGSADDYGRSLAIQSDGKILLGGYCLNGSNDDFCIARFK